MTFSPDLEALEVFCRTPLEEHLGARGDGDGLDLALSRLRSAAVGSAAYGEFLRQHGVDAASVHTADALGALPTISKDTFLRQHSLPELCFAGERVDTVAVSSGSTGIPTYFPRSIRHEVAVAWRFEQLFRDTFAAHERSTLAVVCFPLGTWVGGMFTAACCRWLALKGYRLLVVPCGNQPPEIWRAVRELGPAHDQVVLLGYPPFLKDVIDGGELHGVEWGRVPLGLVMAGEVVSEAWRDILHARSGARRPLSHFAASLYGTADAGVLGVESVVCTAIRRFCVAHPEAGERLFGERRLPTLVQYDPRQCYFESSDEGLVLTASGGAIPLVRYAIGDRGGLIEFEEAMALLEPLGFTSPPNARRLPFVFVFGRSQHAVSFYGANVFVETVRLGLEHEAVRDAVTGKLVMAVTEDEEGAAHLCIDVELSRGVEPDSDRTHAIAAHMRAALLASSPEFRAYVPLHRQTPEVASRLHGDPEHFPVGVKHRYIR